MSQHNLLTMRALDPTHDADLFEEAYSWRAVRRLVYMPEGYIEFTEFAHPKPNEAVMGLFNGQLQAVFLLQGREHEQIEVHFTTRPQVRVDWLTAGAVTLKNRLFDYGTSRIYGWLRERHARPRHPVRRFAESIGFFPTGESQVFGHAPEFYWWRKFASHR